MSEQQQRIVTRITREINENKELTKESKLIRIELMLEMIRRGIL